MKRFGNPFEKNIVLVYVHYVHAGKCCNVDLFMVVERSKDILHVKLLESLVTKISKVSECKREQVITYM